MHKSLAALVVASLILGVMARLIWPSDMEYKYDEQYLFEATQAHVVTGTWPSLGMDSGAGLPNPGLSFWPFIAAGFFLKDPLSLTIFVQVLNCFALVILGILFFKKFKDKRDQASASLGLALFAVSPIPIILARKLWAQSILPIFSAVAITAHMHRHRAVGAFLWGLFGGIIGQIHMSGFYAAAGFFATTVAFERSRRIRRWIRGDDAPATSTRWLWWFLGSLVALIPLLPWIKVILSGAMSQSSRSFAEVFTMKFFTQWFGNAWGINTKVSLGRGSNLLWDFLREPMIFGVSTYLMAAAHLMLLGLGLYFTVKWLAGKWLADRHSLSAGPQVRFYLIAFGIVAGVVAQGSGASVHAHYQIVFSPWIHIWTAALLLGHPRVFKAVLGLNILISACFLWMIHRDGGFPQGAYGKSYRMQTQAPQTKATGDQTPGNAEEASP